MKVAAARTHSLSNPRGRPRQFDMVEAVDKAIPVLCERGFYGTSINHLAEAMQLTVGSIYKAFKDKRGVFLAALDRQSALRNAQLRKAMSAATTGRERLRAALLFYVGLSHGPEGIQGCLIISTAVDLATSDPEIAQGAGDLFRRRESQLAELLQEGQSDGSISADIDREGTARLMLCLLQGLRVIGKTGRTRKELLMVVDVAMKTLD
jgi:TetR/AcrR family transcriptional repressor of nem operon